MTKEIGTIKWFNRRKGFGFIQRKLGDKIFVHVRDISKKESNSLKEGQCVEFKLVEGPKGPKAEDVSIYDISSE